MTTPAPFSSRELHCHRSVPRLTDNPALGAACDADEAVGAFALDRSVLQCGSAVRVASLLSLLDALGAAYRDRGSDRVVVRGARSVEPPGPAPGLNVDRVRRNVDCSGLARDRSRAVRDGWRCSSGRGG